MKMQAPKASTDVIKAFLPLLLSALVLHWASPTTGSCLLTATMHSLFQQGCEATVTNYNHSEEEWFELK